MALGSKEWEPGILHKYYYRSWAEHDAMGTDQCRISPSWVGGPLDLGLRASIRGSRTQGYEETIIFEVVERLQFRLSPY